MNNEFSILNNNNALLGTNGTQGYSAADAVYEDAGDLRFKNETSFSESVENPNLNFTPNVSERDAVEEELSRRVPKFAQEFYTKGYGADVSGLREMGDSDVKFGVLAEAGRKQAEQMRAATFDGFMQKASLMRKFGKGYVDGVFDKDALDSQTAYDFGIQMLRLFPNMLHDTNGVLEREFGVKSIEELGRKTAAVIMQNSESVDEMRKRLSEYDDGKAIEEAKQLQRMAGIGEEKIFTPPNKEEAVRICSYYNRQGLRVWEASLGQLDDEKERRFAFGLTTMSEEGRQKVLSQMIAESPSMARRVAGAAQTLMAYYDGHIGSAAVDGFIDGLVNAKDDFSTFVDYMFDPNDTLEGTAVFTAIQRHSLLNGGEFVTTEAFEKMSDDEIVAIAQSVSFSTQKKRHERIKLLATDPHTGVSPMWDDWSSVRNAAQLREQFNRGYAYFEAKHGSALVKQLSQPKFRDGEWGKELIYGASSSVGYYSPVMISSAASPLTMGVLGFGENMNEFYANGDVTATVDEKMAAATAYGAFMAVAGSVGYGVLSKGIGFIYKPVAGVVGKTAVGGAVSRFSERGLLGFVKSSVNDETAVFLAKHGDGLLMRLAALTARSAVRTSGVMGVEGAQEATEELVRRWAHEAFVEVSKNYDGKNYLEEQPIVEAMWEAFKMGALTAPLQRAGLGSPQILSGMYKGGIKKNALFDGKSMLTAKAERLWAFTGAQEAFKARHGEYVSAEDARKQGVKEFSEVYDFVRRLFSADSDGRAKVKSDGLYDGLKDWQKRKIDELVSFYDKTDARGKALIESALLNEKVGMLGGKGYTEAELTAAREMFTYEMMRAALTAQVKADEKQLKELEDEQRRREYEAAQSETAGVESEERANRKWGLLSDAELQTELKLGRQALEQGKAELKDTEAKLKERSAKLAKSGKVRDDIAGVIGSTFMGDTDAAKNERNRIRYEYKQLKDAGADTGWHAILAKASGFDIESEEEETAQTRARDTARAESEARRAEAQRALEEAEEAARQAAEAAAEARRAANEREREIERERRAEAEVDREARAEELRQANEAERQAEEAAIEARKAYEEAQAKHEEEVRKEFENERVAKEIVRREAAAKELISIAENHGLDDEALAKLAVLKGLAETEEEARALVNIYRAQSLLDEKSMAALFRAPMESVRGIVECAKDIAFCGRHADINAALVWMSKHNWNVSPEKASVEKGNIWFKMYLVALASGDMELLRKFTRTNAAFEAAYDARTSDYIETPFYGISENRVAYAAAVASLPNPPASMKADIARVLDNTQVYPSGKLLNRLFNEEENAKRIEDSGLSGLVSYNAAAGNVELQEELNASVPEFKDDSAEEAVKKEADKVLTKSTKKGTKKEAEKGNAAQKVYSDEVDKPKSRKEGESKAFSDSPKVKAVVDGKKKTYTKGTFTAPAPYLITGNKGVMMANNSGFYHALGTYAKLRGGRMFDLFGGSAIYIYGMNAMGVLPDGARWNEWTTERYLTNKHIKDNTEKVISAVKDIYARFLYSAEANEYRTAIDKYNAKDPTRYDDGAFVGQPANILAKWIIDELNGRHAGIPAYYTKKGEDSHGAFLKDEPRTAAIYLFAQAMATQSRALQSSWYTVTDASGNVVRDELVFKVPSSSGKTNEYNRKGMSAAYAPSLVISGSHLEFYHESGGKKVFGKNGRLSDIEAFAEVIRSAGKLFNEKRVEITQGDGWAAAKTAKKGDVVFIDPAYLGTMGYASGVESDANPEVFFNKAKELIEYGNANGVTYVFTNEYKASGKDTETGINFDDVYGRLAKLTNADGTPMVSVNISNRGVVGGERKHEVIIVNDGGAFLLNPSKVEVDAMTNNESVRPAAVAKIHEAKLENSGLDASGKAWAREWQSRLIQSVLMQRALSVFSPIGAERLNLQLRKFGGWLGGVNVRVVDDVEAAVNAAADARRFVYDTEQAAWNDVLDKYEAGTLPARAFHKVLNRTPVVLQRLGLKNRPITIRKDTIDKILGRTPNKAGDFHNVPMSALRGILGSIDNPVAVFKSVSPNAKNAIVVLTESIDLANGEKVIVPIEIDEQTGVIKSHRISSAYGRPNADIRKWVESKNLLYWNTKKLPPLLTAEEGAIPSTLPEGASRIGSNVLTEEDFTDDELGIVKRKEIRGDVNGIRRSISREGRGYMDGGEWSQRAFHGSPHNFAAEENAPLWRFRDDKMGSGEVFGAYDPTTKQVYISKNARADTLLHELGWHATFDWAAKNAPELRDQMVKFARRAPMELKAAVADAYGYDYEAWRELDEEKDAKFLDEIGAAFFSQEYTEAIEAAIDAELDGTLRGKMRRAWNAFKELMFKVWARVSWSYERFYTADGRRKVDLKGILEEAKNPAAVMAKIADAFAKGQLLADLAEARDETDPGSGSEGDFHAWAAQNKGALAQAALEDFRMALPTRNDEYVRIEREARANGTWLKAPNGKPSKLNPRQWVQVRTEAFKKWFGDWEKQARIEKLKKAPTIELTDYTGQYELNRDSARKWALENLRTKYVINDTGENIELQSVGAKKVTSHSTDSEVHLKSIASIPTLLKNAIFISETQSEKDNAKFDSYRYYVAGIKIEGVDYTARITVGVKNGKRFYDHSLTQIEKGILVNLASNKQGDKNASNGFKAKGSTTVALSSADVKDKRLLSLLQADSSKIVDENGEPLAVYSGTRDANHTVFTDKMNKPGDKGVMWGSNQRGVARSYAGTDAEASWETVDDGAWGTFTESTLEAEKADEYDQAAGYSGEIQPGVYSVFLNIRNPKRVDANGRRWNEIQTGGKQKKSVEFSMLPDDVAERVAREMASDTGVEVELDENGDWVNFEECADAIEEYYREYNAETDDDGNIVKYGETPKFYENGDIAEVVPATETTRDIANRELGNGNDGIVFYNIEDKGRFGGNFGQGVFNIGTNVYVVPSSEQIKSATENVGTFDGGNADIRYQRALPNTRREVNANANAAERAVNTAFDESLRVYWKWQQKVLEDTGFTADILSRDSGGFEAHSFEALRNRISAAFSSEATTTAARMRTHRMAARKAGVQQPKAVKRLVERYDLPPLGSERGGIVGWGRKVAEIIRAQTGDDALALEATKSVLSAYYHRLSVRILSAANAIKVDDQLDAIEEDATMEKVLSRADRIEELLSEKAEQKTLDELRDGVKAMLARFGKYEPNVDEAKRKLFGATERALHSMRGFERLRASVSWESLFEEKRNKLLDVLNGANSTQEAKIEALADMQALEFWWAKPLRDMSAAELLAVQDKIAEMVATGAALHADALARRDVARWATWSAIGDAVADSASNSGRDVSDKHYFGWLKFGYSVRSRLESAIKYATQDKFDAAIEAIRELDLRITEANNAAAGMVADDEYSFFAAILRYAGREKDIAPNRFGGKYVKMSRAAEDVIRGELDKKVSGSEKFSAKGEKLTWLELMAQYLMMRQKEWADIYNNEPENKHENDEAYKRWLRNGELSDFLGADKVKLAEEVSAILQAHAARIDKQAVKDAGVPLSYRRGDGYFPLVHDMKDYMKNVHVKVSGGVPSVIPHILIPRQHSRKDIDEHADLLHVFRRNVFDTAQYIAMGESGVGADLRWIMGDKGAERVQENIAKMLGANGTNALWEHLIHTVNGKLFGAELYNELSGAYGAATAALLLTSRMLGLGYNLISGFKQVFGGLPSYVLSYGFKDTVMALLKNPAASLSVYKELMESDGYVQRYGNNPMVRLLKGAGTPRFTKELLRAENYAMSFTSYADRLPLLLVGSSIYAAMKNAYVAQGKTLEEAKELALRDFWRVQDTTQQARQMQNMDSVSRSNTPWGKLFVQFKTSPIQFFSEMMHAAETAAARRDGESMGKLATAIFHNHVLQVSAMLLANAIGSWVLDSDEDDDEDGFVLADLAMFVIGSFNAIPVLGEMVEYGVNKVFGDEQYYSSNFASAPAAESATRIVERSGKLFDTIFDGEDGTTTEAALKLAESAAVIRYLRKAYDKYIADEDG